MFPKPDDALNDAWQDEQKTLTGNEAVALDDDDGSSDVPPLDEALDEIPR